MAQLLDQYGRPVDLSALRKEQAAATVTGVRQILSGHPSAGLNPGRLGALLRDAEQGDPMAYLELAEDLEEKDLRYRAVLASRKLAVSRMEISVVAAGDDAQSQKDADFIRAWLERPVLRKELRDILDAIGKGYSATEIIWDTAGGSWKPSALKWRDPRWFRFDRIDGETLRLLDEGGQQTPLPPYKFIVHRSSSKSGMPIRGGLARAVCWYTMFKSFAIKDWVVFMEAYGHPLRVGKYPAGATAEEKATLLRAVRSIASDAGAIIPQSMMLEFVNAMTQGQPTVHQGFVTWADTQISILVLGQNLSTEVKGGSLAAAEQHGDQKKEICAADGEDLAVTLSDDLVRPMIDLNFGPRAIYPRLEIAFPEDEDLKAFLANVETYVGMGGRVASSVIRDKLQLPDPGADEELLRPRSAAAPATDDEEGTGDAVPPTQKAAASAEHAGDDDAINEAVDEILARGGFQPASEEAVDALQLALGRANTREEALSIITGWVNGLDQGASTEILARLMFNARLAGEAGEALHESAEQ
jgi:phage gp29-like protein